MSRRRQLNDKYKESKPKDAFTIRYKQAIEGLQYPETSETYRESVEWLKANTDYRAAFLFYQINEEFIRIILFMFPVYCISGF